MTYEPVIGLEIHVQTKTKSKMFCGCSTDYFGAPPNTHTCPVCLGLPGALPVPNRKALELAVTVALALSCTINKESKFDRKNYFYPDLPKGYQISQYDQPIGEHGSIEIDVNGITKSIGITRVHQEEDTGKSIHQKDLTLLDYNKSGTPLLEIVTEPELHSGPEVSALAKKLRQIMRYLDASNADMEKGQMRIEPNISLRPVGSIDLPNYKVEVKNISSISVLEKVITLEIARQKEILESGDTPVQETRGLVDMSGKTVSQRIKETANDYRYFPEPDIPPMMLDDQYIKTIKDSLPELPQEKKHRYIKEFHIDHKTSETIVQNRSSAKKFEDIIAGLTEDTLISDIANWYVGEYAQLSKKYDPELCKPMYLRELAELVHAGNVSRTIAKTVLETSFKTGKSPEEIVKKERLATVSDESLISKAADEVIAENSKAIADSKKNPNAIMFLVGQVMKKMQGKADPAAVRSILEGKIKRK